MTANPLAQQYWQKQKNTFHKSSTKNGPNVYKGTIFIAILPIVDQTWPLVLGQCKPVHWTNVTKKTPHFWQEPNQQLSQCWQRHSFHSNPINCGPNLAPSVDPVSASPLDQCWQKPLFTRAQPKIVPMLTKAQFSKESYQLWIKLGAQCWSNVIQSIWPMLGTSNMVDLKIVPRDKITFPKEYLYLIG